jgi:hypothetical protein
VRKAVLLGVLLAVLSAASAFAFDPAELNRLTFVNSTGREIQMVFLSPTDSEYWGPDIIPTDFVLKVGASVDYYVHSPHEVFTYDVLATDGKGSSIEMRDLKLTRGRKQTVTLASTDLKREAPQFTLAMLTVENDTGGQIQYLFMSPADSDAWGADLLTGDTTLQDGESWSISVPVGKEKAPYNFFAEDEDGRAFFFGATLDPSRGTEFSVSIDRSDLSGPGAEE